jgi:hypothetical protein
MHVQLASFVDAIAPWYNHGINSCQQEYQGRVRGTCVHVHLAMLQTQAVAHAQAWWPWLDGSAAGSGWPVSLLSVSGCRHAEDLYLAF